jgi:Bacteriophage Lambda NinG protein.
MQKKLKTKKSSISSLKKRVQAKANRYVRLRDCAGTGGGNCISCGEWFPFEKLDAGHYRPTTHSSTRFREDNVHIQCHKCNRFLHGNLSGYFRGLEEKIGRKALDELDSVPRDYKWTRDELEELSKYYGDKIKQLERGEIDPGMEVPDLRKDL